MLTDTEQYLQQAMKERAATVTAENLTHPVLDLSAASAAPRVTRRRVRPALAGIVTAVCVAAIAVTVSVIATRGDGHSATGGSAALRAALAGYRWRTVSVDDGHGPLPVPTSYGSTIEFDSTGTVLADDGVNALSGRYSVTGTDLTIRDAASTAAGYVGSDAVTLAVTDVMQRLFFVIVQDLSTAPAAPTVASHIALTGDQLTLTLGSRALTFVRDGPTGPPATAGASQTSTAQSSASSAGAAQSSVANSDSATSSDSSSG